MALRDRYDLGEVLGDTVFARTHAARDLRSGADVVVKLLRVKGLSDWKPVELLQREATVLRNLDHPGVPRLVEAFEDRGDDGAMTMVLVVERVPGKTLGKLIQEGHRWDPAAARALMEQLLDTLAYLHGLSPPVIHRDIKPSNVIIRPDGRPVLVDFGAVRDLAARNDGGLTVVGTAGYMPPEQAMGRATPASDVYSLGATLIHAFSHEHPADLPRIGMTLQFTDRVGVDERVLSVLQRMVEPDLEKRFGRAQAAMAGLRAPEIVDGQPLDRGVEATRFIGRVAPGPAFLTVLPAPPRSLDVAVETRLLSWYRVLRTRSPLFWMMVGYGFFFGSMGTLPFTMPLRFEFWASLMLGGTGFVATMEIYVVAMRRSMRRLLRFGTETQGTIHSVSANPALSMHVEIGFTYSVNGESFSGTYSARAPAELDVARKGNPITVVYDPRKPQRYLAFLVLPKVGKRVSWWQRWLGHKETSASEGVAAVGDSEAPTDTP